MALDLNRPMIEIVVQLGRKRMDHDPTAHRHWLWQTVQPLPRLLGVSEMFDDGV